MKKISFFSLISALTTLQWCFLAPYANCDEFLKSSKLTESSGICSDSKNRIWTHNDSGDSPRLFCFSQNGSLIGTFVFDELSAKDWEDICYFELNGDQFVVVGDVGDNAAVRPSVELHIFRLQDQKARPEFRCSVQVDYEAGPVNCEAICFDPNTNEILLLSKELTRCRVFTVNIASAIGRKRETIKRKASLISSFPVPMVTGADISKAGEDLVLCTYGPGAWISRAKKDSNLWDQDSLRLFALPPRRQGEAICFDQSGDELLLTSERAPTRLYRLKLSELKYAEKNWKPKNGG